MSKEMPKKFSIINQLTGLVHDVPPEAQVRQIEDKSTYTDVLDAAFARETFVSLTHVMPSGWEYNTHKYTIRNIKVVTVSVKMNLYAIASIKKYLRVFLDGTLIRIFDITFINDAEEIYQLNLFNEDLAAYSDEKVLSFEIQYWASSTTPFDTEMWLQGYQL
jgi:hypothetical protein